MRVGINALLGATEPGLRATGMSRYVTSLLAGLERIGGSDELVAFVGQGLPTPSPVLRLRRAPALVRHPVLRIGWEQAALPVLARTERLQVFHGATNTLPLVLGTPAIVTIHDLAFLRYPEHVRRRRYHYLRYMVRRATRQARFVITPSEATRTDVLELLGGDPDMHRRDSTRRRRSLQPAHGGPPGADAAALRPRRAVRPRRRHGGAPKEPRGLDRGDGGARGRVPPICSQSPAPPAGSPIDRRPQSLRRESRPGSAGLASSQTTI